MKQKKLSTVEVEGRQALLSAVAMDSLQLGAKLLLCGKSLECPCSFVHKPKDPKLLLRLCKNIFCSSRTRRYQPNTSDEKKAGVSEQDNSK